MTSNALFFPVGFLSALYWMNTTPVSHLLMGSVAVSLGFSALFATSKYRKLRFVQLSLDFSNFEKPTVLWLERELNRIGYRIGSGNRIFSAGFRADYYLAPDITVTWENDLCTLTGPAFYARKIAKRHKRAEKRNLRKIRQSTDSTPDQSAVHQ